MLRIENRMAAFLDAQFYRRIDVEYPNFTDHQKECYWRALLEQAMYVFKNGDISVDSGYDYEHGETASVGTIIKKTIAPNAQSELLNCGLWCRALKNPRRGGWWGRLW